MQLLELPRHQRYKIMYKALLRERERERERERGRSEIRIV